MLLAPGPKGLATWDYVHASGGKCAFASMYVAGVTIKVRIATFDQFQMYNFV